MDEVEDFLVSNQEWLVRNIERIERLGSVRMQKNKSEILFRGVKTPVHVEKVARRQGTNKVICENGTLTVVRGQKSQTSPAKTLENWLRSQARQEIHSHLSIFTEKVGRHPNKVYVMGQKTKWGNCSSLRNLSFNWRLIMAPDFVLKYIIAHEVVHLAVPNHSHIFWLTVQSLCPEMDNAKRWLRMNADRLMVDFTQIC